MEQGEYATVRTNEKNQIVFLSGVFKAKNCKEYFAEIKNNMGGTI